LKKGKLYLIPNSLGGGADTFATELSKHIVHQLDDFIVEEIKSVRRMLRQLGVSRELSELNFMMLNEHTKSGELPELIQPLLEGKDVGLISEAGLPCVADPGHHVVTLAHENNIRVIPLSGPSSIMMALMASGMNGQEFTFNGYLPRDKQDRIKKIRALEQLALKGQTQLFMDAPYRNQQLLEDLLTTCRMETRLCIASAISCPDEKIGTKDITGWLMNKPKLDKIPVMFVLGK
jgi:16S rRNA (cytidine1402-2'-O)-methyltransferase